MKKQRPPQIIRLPDRNLTFVGREETLEFLSSTFQRAQTKSISLTGLPGVGLSSIALEYAYRSKEYGIYSDIIYWISLNGGKLSLKKQLIQLIFDILDSELQAILNNNNHSKDITTPTTPTPPTSPTTTTHTTTHTNTDNSNNSNNYNRLVNSMNSMSVSPIPTTSQYVFHHPTPYYDAIESLQRQQVQVQGQQEQSVFPTSTSTLIRHYQQQPHHYHSATHQNLNNNFHIQPTIYHLHHVTTSQYGNTNTPNETVPLPHHYLVVPRTALLPTPALQHPPPHYSHHSHSHQHQPQHQFLPHSSSSSPSSPLPHTILSYHYTPPYPFYPHTSTTYYTPSPIPRSPTTTHVYSDELSTAVLIQQVWDVNRQALRAREILIKQMRKEERKQSKKEDQDQEEEDQEEEDQEDQDQEEEEMESTASDDQIKIWLQTLELQSLSRLIHLLLATRPHDWLFIIDDATSLDALPECFVPGELPGRCNVLFTGLPHSVSQQSPPSVKLLGYPWRLSWRSVTPLDIKETTTFINNYFDHSFPVNSSIPVALSYLKSPGIQELVTRLARFCGGIALVLATILHCLSRNQMTIKTALSKLCDPSRDRLILLPGLADRSYDTLYSHYLRRYHSITDPSIIHILKLSAWFDSDQIPISAIEFNDQDLSPVLLSGAYSDLLSVKTVYLNKAEGLNAANDSSILDQPVSTTASYEEQLTFSVNPLFQAVIRKALRSSTSHPSIVCSCCNSQIQGTRHQCIDCWSFSLCSECAEGPALQEHLKNTEDHSFDALPTEAHTCLSYTLITLRQSWNFSHTDTSTWASSKLLVKHVESVCKHAMELSPTLEIGKIAYLYNSTGLGGFYQFVVGEFHKAMPYYEKSLGLYEKLLGESHHGYSVCLNNLSEVYRSLGLFDRALPLCRKALKLTEEILGTKHQSYSTRLNNLALLHQDAGEFVEALALFKSASDIALDVLGESHADYGLTRQNLANCYEDIGEIELATSVFKDSLAVYKRAGAQNSPRYASCCMGLGSTLRILGQYEPALKYFKTAIAVAETVLGKSHPINATILANLGITQQEIGFYGQARVTLKEARSICSRILGQQHLGYAGRSYNLASLLESLGHYGEAHELFKHVLDIQVAKLKGDHPAVANTYLGLGTLCMATQDYAQARKYISKGHAIRMQVFQGQHHHSLATSLYLIARLSHLDGNYTEARKWATTSLLLRQKTFGGHHQGVAASYALLARIEIKAPSGNLDQGYAYLQKAFTIYNDLFASYTRHHLSFASCHTLFADYYLRVTDVNRCKESLASALLIYDHHLINAVINPKLEGYVYTKYLLDAVTTIPSSSSLSTPNPSHFINHNNGSQADPTSTTSTITINNNSIERDSTNNRNNNDDNLSFRPG